MAAVSQTMVHRDAEQDSGLSAVHDFLQQAIALYRIASSVHSDTDGFNSGAAALVSDVPLLQFIDAVQESLQALFSAQRTSEDQPKAILIDACCKVGRNLTLRLHRLCEVATAPLSDVANSVKFRELWSIQDVSALGVRLGELAQRLRELDPKKDLRLVNAGAFSPLAERLDKEKAQEKIHHVPSAEPSSPTPAKGKNMNSSDSNEHLKNSLHDKKTQVVTSRPRHTPDSIIQEFILESLAYKSMRYREQEVTKAHSKTFEWVFTIDTETEAEHQFSSWLRGEEHGPIYWITGKPGSGKSTFMRFLFHHPSTLQRLDAWAKGQRVCKAGFFFWTSGSKEQRSQTGLLRSIIHQLLSDSPELAESTFPELWARLRIMTTKERIQFQLDWSAEELMTAFNAFVDAALPQHKLCLFIDGLDEFEGDHTAIVNFFKRISTGENGKSVKLCLSSRPWTVFEEAFQHAVPNLRLQDLTYEDMYRYTRDRLRENVQIRRAFKGDAESAEALIKKTIEKSDGVFLWLRLALNQMITGFQQGNVLLQSLADYLETLPTELYDLFTKLLFEDRDETQLPDTAVLFRLMRARELAADFIRDDSANSLTVWELAFAIAKEDDEPALNANVEQADNDIVLGRCKITANQVVKAFAGLLELHARQAQGNMRGPRFADEGNSAEAALQLAEQRVTYIHRTVRDWLMEEPGILKQVVEKSPSGFDPHLRLLRSYILRLKNPFEEIEHHRRLDEWWPDIALAMTHAKYISNDPEHLQRPLLNEMNNTLSWYWLYKPQDPYDHWARNAFGSYEVRMKAPPIWQPFLCLATKFGLTQYIQEELSKRIQEDGDISAEQLQLERPDATPLLAYATEFLCSRKKTIFPLSDPKLVGFLLRNACRISPDANHEYTDFNTRAIMTPWIALLRHLRDAQRRGWIEHYDINREGTARWSEIVRMFLEVGNADANAVIVADRWDSETTALGVLELLDETYYAIEVRELKELILRRQGFHDN